MIGGKKISVSVHIDFQKLVYTEKKPVYTENQPVNEISVHWFLIISASVHTDFQKLVYTENNSVY